MSNEKIAQNKFAGENLDFRALMGILGIWSVDSSSEEYHYELMTEWRGQRVHIWVRNNGNGTYDFRGHTFERAGARDVHDT
tara:strand:+ start:7089 stop:7331 length:243 start_codon:yes stop_codon:yes gene_type:complete